MGRCADIGFMPTDHHSDHPRLREAGDWAGTISLPEMLCSLSFALDLTEDAKPGHALRSCLIGMRIAGRLGLSEAEAGQLYYALLLKDIGCSSNAARMCQIIGGGDDRAIKAGVKLEDWTKLHQPKLSAVRLLWNNVSPGASSFGKAARIFKIAAMQHSNNAELIALRCDRGASIVRKIGLGEGTAEAVRCLDEHWDGSGYPSRLQGKHIPLMARIACLAQHLDVFASEQSPTAAIATMHERSGRWFDPQLVSIAQSLHTSGTLWSGCKPDENGQTMKRVLDAAPGGTDRLSDASLDQICEAFADVVDAKSPFTFRHSMGVTEIAHGLAAAMGLGAARTQFVRRAALLHDLGKLRVPNSILDKNGKLTASEWGIVQEHPMLTRKILYRVRAFDGLAAIAGAHHEKLDGSGYPDRLTGKDIPLEARILAVADIHGALTENRPYRVGLSHEEATRIMEKDVPTKLDSSCYEALLGLHQYGGDYRIAGQVPDVPRTLLPQAMIVQTLLQGTNSGHQQIM